MSISALLSHLRVLSSFGLLAGITYAVVEVCLVRALGLPLQFGDLAILAILFGAGGALGLAAAGMAVLGIRRGKTLSDHGLLSVALWTAGLGYLLVAAKTDYGRQGLAGVFAWTLPGCIAFIGLAGWMQKRRFGPAALGAAFVALSAIFSSLGIAAEELSHLQDERRGAFVGVLAAFALGALALALLGAWIGRERIAAAPLVLMLATSAVCFAVAPDYYPWRAIRRAPVLADQPSGANLILIVLDTVRADHLDLFSYERETMPLLAKRARKEFDVVRTIHSTAPWTLPSHASMFTGVYPWFHGAHNPRAVLADAAEGAQSLRADIPTLAETMASAGYTTAGIVANYGILSGFGMDRGFSAYHAAAGPSYLSRDLLWIYRAFRDDRYKPGFWLHANLPERLARLTTAFDRFRPWQRRAGEIRIEASEWIEDHADKPFFLFLNFMDAHRLYLPVEQDDGYFVKRPPGAGAESFREDATRLQQGGPGPSSDYLEYYEGQYDAEMRQLDRVLDSFFNELEGRGLYDESLIIVTSDHGEEFMEHGLLEHGEALYETLIRVPLLVKLPDSARSGALEVGRALQHVDLFPTAAAVLGFEAPAGLQGKVWGRGRQFALAEIYGATQTSSEPADLAAVIIDDQKLLVSTAHNLKAYDLKLDPKELHPLIPPPAALAGKGVAVTGSRIFDAATELPKEMTLEMRDRLRSLGYIQ